tara:strand:+ start:210 stop:1511 length:1302 start_codon:yes stop_codon:yes gene_type:complete
MRNSYKVELSNTINSFKKILEWSKRFSASCLLLSNDNDIKLPESYKKYDAIFAIGNSSECFSKTDSLKQLSDWYNKNKDWSFGYISYELKNEIEDLTSNNQDNFDFFHIHFFKPKYVILFKDKNVYIESFCGLEEIKRISKEIMYIEIPIIKNDSINLKPAENKKDYLKKIMLIKEHIKKGDIYEMNYCQTFYEKNTPFNPEEVFFKINKESKSPFSAFLKINHNYIICTSPERYICKNKNKILSQPIKGTRRRDSVYKEDQILLNELKNSQKDISENIMITDLVRNDLSKTANSKSVKVNELCQVYSFKQVHQMITTISATISQDIGVADIISTTFPMGSMTGAPKKRAMELIEKYEVKMRGIFSGSIGYISPIEDFDFNVVIRSLIYNKKNKYLSVSSGGAITSKSDPEEEYEECLVKIQSIINSLKDNNC